MTRPRAIWDTSTRRYIVAWDDLSGRPHWTTVADLARQDWQETRFYPETGGRRPRIATTGNVGDVRDGDVTMTAIDTLPIDDATRDRPDPSLWPYRQHDGHRRPPKHPRGTDPRARYRAGDPGIFGRLHRDTGSRLGRRRPRAIEPPGRYMVHGTIRQRRYPAIFAYNRADPDIYRWEHKGKVRYLFVATDDTDNDNVGSVHLPLRIANSVADLADDQGGRAREVDLLNRRTRHDRTAEGRVIAGCYWAPKSTRSAANCRSSLPPASMRRTTSPARGRAWSTVQSHIIQLRDGGDPANPADWSKPAAILKADGRALGRADMPSTSASTCRISSWAAKAITLGRNAIFRPSGPLGDPLTWIAKVDPARRHGSPVPPSPIIAPESSVEENLAEGAFALAHDGRITLVYSSSGVSPTYVVNGISAPLDADLTRIDSWRKWSAPLQKSVAMPSGEKDYRRYEQGPGHGAFTSDEDGVPLYVYHSWGDGVGGNGRDARIRRVHWAADGRPLLDMKPEEEVAPANRRVTMAVTVL